MRKLVCLCEDVTEQELRDAVALGHADLESVKRYCGVGTGPCQGKQCLLACRAVLGQLTGKAPQELGSIVHRPPTAPLALGLLAGEVEEARE